MAEGAVQIKVNSFKCQLADANAKHWLLEALLDNS